MRLQVCGLAPGLAAPRGRRENRCVVIIQGGRR